MRTVTQRVTWANVKVDGKTVGEIEEGLLVLVAVEDSDTEEDIEWLAKKTVGMRVFDDEQGVMNKSILEINGNILIISQFTLFASTRKGNRPSYIRASKGEFANPMYKKFCEKVEEIMGRKVERGIFGADMKVSLLNNGPVTIIMDTKYKE